MNSININELYCSIEQSKSSIEQVLYSIKLTNLTPNTCVKLLVNNYLLDEKIVSESQECIFIPKDKYYRPKSKYYRPKRFDTFIIEFSEPQPNCVAFFDTRDLPEEKRRLPLPFNTIVIKGCAAGGAGKCACNCSSIITYYKI